MQAFIPEPKYMYPVDAVWAMRARNAKVAEYPVADSSLRKIDLFHEATETGRFNVLPHSLNDSISKYIS